jgi:energy-coupling factor transporter ATP-binding protein EcfA2
MESATVEDIVLRRLNADNVPDTQASLVLAVLSSRASATDAELEQALRGQAPARAARPTATAGEQPAARRVYLKAIRVGGFRGIGPARELRLQPGPGLTLIIGRNGSGKSSFAEAAELALTGDNWRWSRPGRATEREGWRNLHAGDEPGIYADLAIDGEARTATVGREWKQGAGLGDAIAYVQRDKQPREGLESLGWATDLEWYRPFLSYSELGSLVGGKPSEMHDALERILGLGQLKDAEDRLGVFRRQLEATSKAGRQDLPGLRAQLTAHPDERARAAMALLGGRVPDLAALEVLSAGGDASPDGEATRLRQLASITLPTATAVTMAIEELSAARETARRLASTAAGDARRLAGLLSAALDHHADHAGEPCPVCRGRALDDDWATATRAEVARLANAAQEAEAAHDRLALAQKAVGVIVGPKPPVLSGIDTHAASAAWDRWAELAAIGQATEDAFLALDAAVVDVTAQAARQLTQRSEAWRPVALALAGWVAKYRDGQHALAALADVKRAADWLKATGGSLRNERLAPFTEGSARVWTMLRQESNVELGPVTLAGTGTKRHVSLDVTVDGVAGAALSVMSQGELHALGLALFLPRATAASSPFGFLIIDDPVQSMDPAKVDGLARVLSEYATARQVVVFTHDDRLPAAIKQLQLPATIWEVTRREHSEVSLRKRDDAVSRYVEDALALAQTNELADAVKAVAVAGTCRLALEAACVEVVRRKRIGGGVPHVEVEEALEAAARLRDKLALALFDDATRGGEVKPALNKLGGQPFVAVFSAAKDGVHEPYPGSLRELARDTEKLAKAIRR